jgi:hypothetical protein
MKIRRLEPVQYSFVASDESILKFNYSMSSISRFMNLEVSPAFVVVPQPAWQPIDNQTTGI